MNVSRGLICFNNFFFSRETLINALIGVSQTAILIDSKAVNTISYTFPLSISDISILSATVQCIYVF